jgi:hypothetical protein
MEEGGGRKRGVAGTARGTCLIHKEKESVFAAKLAQQGELEDRGQQAASITKGKNTDGRHK